MRKKKHTVGSLFEAKLLVQALAHRHKISYSIFVDPHSKYMGEEFVVQPKSMRRPKNGYSLVTDYVPTLRNSRRKGKRMRIKVRHRSRNRRVMKRNLPLKKKYGSKYFTVKAFARKYAKKFGGKAKARKQWSKLREAKHGSTKLKTQRNKRRRKARKSRLNFRSRSGR
jgi:hypothetical protein